MNPEEGELRPQLADRFALHISVEGIYDIEQRVEIIKRNLEFGENPVGFSEKWKGEQEKLRKSIVDARDLIGDVDISSEFMQAIAMACINLHVDGHRPDISTVRTAKALAAFEGRTTVSPEDIRRVSVMAVGYRTRGFGFEEPATPAEVRDTFRSVLQKIE
jgi:Mg-chelatase subunit ChlI